MAGLLDNMAANPITQIGLGLLSQGPSATPINPWQGVQRGLLNAQNARYDQQQLAQQKQLYDMRMQQMQAQEEARRAQATQQAQEQQRMEAFVSTLPPEQQALARANPGEFYKEYVGQQFAEPEKGTSAMQEYQAALQQGYKGSFVDYQTMMKNAGRTSVEINNGSDFKVPPGFMRDPESPGRVVPIPGGPKDPESSSREFTDTQTQAGGYAGRMAEAEARINGVVGENFNPGGGSGAKDKVLQSGGLATNWMRSKEGQVYEQAQHDWVRAKLRKESGAVIADEEMEREIKTYFPQPGDSKEVIAAKAKSRAIAIEAMKNQASGGVGGNAPITGSEAAPPESGVTDWNSL